MAQPERDDEKIDEFEEIETENTPPPTSGEDERGRGSYIFALKVLGILAAIIAVIVILKMAGVPFAVRDWFRTAAEHIPLLF